MRFIRTNTTKQKVVELDDIPSLKTKTETAFTPETKRVIPQIENTSTRASVNETDEITEEETTNYPEVVSSSFPKSVQDSTTVSSEEANSIKNEALYAQKLGSRSLLLSILGVGFVFLGIVALILALIEFGPIAGYVALGFLLLALVSWIVGLFSGIKALRAPFNTPRGRRRAIAGIIICSIPLVNLLISTILTFLPI